MTEDVRTERSFCRICTAVCGIRVDVEGNEVVRVRVVPSWLRVDARFGSVYRRRGHAALVVR